MPVPNPPVSPKAITKEGLGAALAKEIYVGNLPKVHFSMRELQNFLNDAMIQGELDIDIKRELGPTEPIVGVRRKDSKSQFAFLEMRCPEEATAALNMDGIEFQGQTLKIGRPAKYRGPVTEHVQWGELVRQKRLLEHHGEVLGLPSSTQTTRDPPIF